MTEAVPQLGRVSAKRYLELSECEIISPDDRVELLQGMVVAMAAQSAQHASTVFCVQHVLQSKLGPPPGRARARDTPTAQGSVGDGGA